MADIEVSWLEGMYPFLHCMHAYIINRDLFWLYDGFILLFVLFHSPICSDTQAVMQIEWLQDGAVVYTGTDTSLQLSRNPVQLSDAGLYSCRATLSNGTMLGPVNAGQLRVFGEYTCMHLKVMNNLYMQVHFVL